MKSWLKWTMPEKKYIVSLNAEERQFLEQFTTPGKASVSAINHARILLKADINQPDGGWKDEAIRDALEISVSTIERVRERFVEESLEACLKPRPRQRSRSRCLDGEQEAHLIAIACSSAPSGQARWTLRLLADRLVEVGEVEQISHETVRQTLKKMNLSLG
jgi:transposase